MKDIRVKTLTLKNFKGIDNFELDAAGDDLSVYGNNSTGKTTIFDAFTWLLYDKDSLNSAQFEIKSLDKTGEASHGLEHSVEGSLLVDGTELTLKKVYFEKWTKKRGSAKAEFTGHTTDYYIDNVPVKLKEYKDQINDLCPEGLSKLLTNPRYFNEILSWQDRRKKILEICGDISDQDVIDSNPDLEELPGILGKHSTDNYKKIIASKRVEINKELEKIPVRIDEITGSRVQTRTGDQVKEEIATFEKMLSEGQRTLSEVEAGGNVAVITSQIREIENQIREIDGKQADTELSQRRERDNELSKLEAAKRELSSKLQDADHQKKYSDNRIKLISAEIDSLDIELSMLRDQWETENAHKFDFIHASECPTCGQSLPEEKLNEARENAEKAFNQAKANTLKAITEKGQAQTAVKEKYIIEANEHEIKSAKFKNDIFRLTKELDAAVTAIQEFESAPVAEKEVDPKRQALVDQKYELEDKVLNARKNLEESTRDIRDEISSIESRIESLKNEQRQIDANARIDTRVKELSDQERKLSAEYEELERHLYLIEQFIRTKVSLLEEKINSKFSFAKFKLFSEQINSGLAECCEVTLNGVPYNSINNAGRTQIGLDVINTLKEYYQIKLPIFIDNREGIIEIPQMESQVISLYVSEQDKALRVDAGEQKERKAA